MSRFARERLWVPTPEMHWLAEREFPAQHLIVSQADFRSGTFVAYFSRKSKRHDRLLAHFGIEGDQVVYVV
jgi:hypothetical protein